VRFADAARWANQQGPLMLSNETRRHGGGRRAQNRLTRESAGEAEGCAASNYFRRVANMAHSVTVTRSEGAFLERALFGRPGTTPSGSVLAPEVARQEGGQGASGLLGPASVRSATCWCQGRPLR
jgi:hypothetical protein